MDEYLSEKEQVEKLRLWWRENGPFVIGGLVLGVLALSGWNYWQSWQIERSENAKVAYDKLVIAVDNADQDTVATQLAELSGEYSSTPYLSQARLLAARMHVDGGDLDRAAAELDRVVREAKDPELVRIARTRLARVLLANGDTEGALAALDLSSAGVFAPRYHELRGDVLVARGETTAAREEYVTALAGAEQGIVNRQSVQRKLDALGGNEASEAGEGES